MIHESINRFTNLKGFINLQRFIELELIIIILLLLLGATTYMVSCQPIHVFETSWEVPRSRIVSFAMGRQFMQGLNPQPKLNILKIMHL